MINEKKRLTQKQVNEFMNWLQDEVIQLQQENAELKARVEELEGALTLILNEVEWNIENNTGITIYSELIKSLKAIAKGGEE